VQIGEIELLRFFLLWIVWLERALEL